ncbi:MAG: hypothetical protein GY796_08640 [Chloroflexi bacterium]|nr:hypothetical protein [Chloroflexota bacterium]
MLSLLKGKLHDSADLHLSQFEHDLQDTTCLQVIGRDHKTAVSHHIFGTPTFHFPNSNPIYVKLDAPIPDNNTLDFWQMLYRMSSERPYLLELKRAQS